MSIRGFARECVCVCVGGGRWLMYDAHGRVTPRNVFAGAGGYLQQGRPCGASRRAWLSQMRCSLSTVTVTRG